MAAKKKKPKRKVKRKGQQRYSASVWADRELQHEAEKGTLIYRRVMAESQTGTWKIVALAGWGAFAITAVMLTVVMVP